MSAIVVDTADHALEAVTLAMTALAHPVQPTDRPMLQVDQREDLDRYLAIARGALVQAYQVLHGRLPPADLAVEQERIRRGR